MRPFDFTGFNNFYEDEEDQKLLLAEDCAEGLKKHHSLLITDLSVVEDIARTFNTSNSTGNSVGFYTFSNVISNMVNSTVTNSKRDFLKNWLRYYTIDVLHPSGSGILSKKRSFVFKFLIAPWISKARGDANQSISIDDSNWEAQWDLCSETEILKWAPFKLTAIANRIDLRGSFHHNKNISNAGETRLIYTLVNLYGGDINNLNIGVKGGVPINFANDGEGQDFVDWKGMNIIFEYKNVQKTKCELVEFAQKWANLSDMTLNSDVYRTKLEEIVSTVVNANAMPNSPNGSALARMRTNEKIFFPTIAGAIQPDVITSWKDADWQFKQFELNSSTHMFEQVFLTNTPISQTINSSSTQAEFNVPTNLLPEFFGSGAWDLTDWIYKSNNQYFIKREQHKLPEKSLNNNAYFLGKSADVNNEFAMYWDFDYSVNTPNFSKTTELNSNNSNAKELRFKFSLNTCQGCHAGETKTIFTMIAPLGYGQSANYWRDANDGPPDSRIGKLDGSANSRSLVNNIIIPLNVQKTVVDGTIYNNYSTPANNRAFVNVSAFLTGRTWDGTSYEDDEERSSFDGVPDNKFDGLFYVNDPSNVNTNGLAGSQQNNFGFNDRRNGFNDLERRKKHLCELINSDCIKVNEQNYSKMNFYDWLKTFVFQPLQE